MVKVILTAAAMAAAYILGGISMLRYLAKEYPAAMWVLKAEHEVNREEKEEKKALEAKDDA